MKRLMKVVIDEVSAEPSTIHPIIVNFQNGELKDEEALKMSCGVYYDQQKQKTMLGLSNGRIVYKGYKPNMENELVRTMLVFHNRRTGKTRLVQAERWQVSAVLDKPSIDDSSSLIDEKNAVLNKQFGSKKVKRRTEQLEKMKVNVEAIKGQLEETVSSLGLNREDLSTLQQNTEFLMDINIPTCNREANSVCDVYQIDTIIPTSILETLYESANMVLNEEAEGKSKFFVRTLNTLKMHPDRVRQVAILIYIDAVCTWLNTPIKDAKRHCDGICPASPKANSYVIDTYSVHSAHGRARPNTMKDKGLIHCLILALTISKFTVDLELFASLIINRISLKKLTALARIIGAVPSKENKNLICLKLPLPPQLNVARKGIKKK